MVEEADMKAGSAAQMEAAAARELVFSGTAYFLMHFRPLIDVNEA
jgi:hypothetical protein